MAAPASRSAQFQVPKAGPAAAWAPASVAVPLDRFGPPRAAGFGYRQDVVMGRCRQGRLPRRAGDRRQEAPCRGRGDRIRRAQLRAPCRVRRPDPEAGGHHARPPTRGRSAPWSRRRVTPPSRRNAAREEAHGRHGDELRGEKSNSTFPRRHDPQGTPGVLSRVTSGQASSSSARLAQPSGPRRASLREGRT